MKVKFNLIKNSLYADLETSVIEEKKLTKIEVCRIVNEWYTLGLCDYLLHDEDGNDLEEILEDEIY
jgi:hypothetical protein